MSLLQRPLPGLRSAYPPFDHFACPPRAIDFHAEIVLGTACAEDEFGVSELMSAAKLHRIAKTFETMSLVDTGGLVAIGLEKHLGITASQCPFHTTNDAT